MLMQILIDGIREMGILEHANAGRELSWLEIQNKIVNFY
jgi:hypothetical protein